MTAIDPPIEREALRLFEQVIDLPAADRRAWIERHSDIGSILRTRLLALLKGDSLANLRTGGAALAIDTERLPDRIGGYRIVARVGRGGMGAVYRGERILGDFDHLAAIKVIKPGLLSERLIDRFQRERQTLARLDHPHIARLFDGGETTEGAPYIVMEFVDGEPILNWCDAHRLALPERLRLFGDVCSAVSYAHQNLIVHRDITPSNVLVTHRGIAKLIDFGIARPTQEDRGAPPLPGGSLATLSLTPGFAAPERITGGEATTVGDVYSLGKLLAALIDSGKAPPPELAAIVARACAPDPAARYSSVDALAADLAAYRSDFPVGAMLGGKRYAARKFYSRHRFAVIGTAVALALLLAALSATLWALDRSSAARRDAEARFTQTRAIAKTMIFDAYDAVSRTPGSTRARAILAGSGLRYLNALASDRDAPFDVRVETGRGFARLADVIGSGGTGTLGKLADSTALLDRAQAILERAHAERPGDLAVTHALAALHVDRARDALFNGNEIALSRHHAQTALALVRDDSRRDAAWAQIYAGALTADGEALSWQLNWQDARRRYTESLRFIARLPPTPQQDRRVQRVRASTLRLLGESLHKLGQKDAARRTLDDAAALQEKLLAAMPDDPIQQRAVAAANWYRAVVHRTNERDAAAAASISRAVAVATRMRNADRDDAAAAHLWLLMVEVQAQTLIDENRIAEAFAANEAMMAEYRRLIALSGSAPGNRRSFSSALRIIGSNFYNGRSFERACDAWRESERLLQWLATHGVSTDGDRQRQHDVRLFIMKSCNPSHQGLGAEL